MMASAALDSRKMSLEPFLKWAGGKRWFAARHMIFVPPEFVRFIEPFLGGGAMFFALQPEASIVSDINLELVGCYVAIRDNPAAISEGLRVHQVMHSKDHYYRVRSSVPSNDIERAVRFLYLNRTCWNGLYRVNKKNEFNVPIGTKSTVEMPNDNFDAVSKVLNRATILSCDFEETLALAEAGDFAFVDPPYTVKHNLNGFVKYNDKIFTWLDQVRLRNAIEEAASRGVKILVTNANHSSIRELYEGLGRQDIVSRSSVLAAQAEHRASTDELVIRTWLNPY